MNIIESCTDDKYILNIIIKIFCLYYRAYKLTEYFVEENSLKHITNKFDLIYLIIKTNLYYLEQNLK